jgi:hypothetical protein
MAATEGRTSGILVTSRAETGQPQEPQHSDPKGEAGPTGPARGVPLDRRPRQSRRFQKIRVGGEFEGRGFRGAPRRRPGAS